jgi:hypothetical protein
MSITVFLLAAIMMMHKLFHSRSSSIDYLISIPHFRSLQCQIPGLIKWYDGGEAGVFIEIFAHELIIKMVAHCF